MKNTNNSNKKKQIPRASRINVSGTVVFEVAVFAFIIFYLCGFAFDFFTRKTVPFETISFGEINAPKEFKGVLIRDETVTIAKESGKAFFSFNDGDYVKRGSVVCTIKDVQDTVALEKEMSAIDQNILKQQNAINNTASLSDDVKRINSRIKSIADTKQPQFIDHEISDIYKYKYQLQKEMDSRNLIILSSGQDAIPELEKRSKVEKQLSDKAHPYSAEVGGVLCYKIDGFEKNFTVANIDNLTYDDIKIATNYENQTASDKIIKANDPVFKIVDLNTWYIAAYLDNEHILDWEVGLNKYLYFKNDSLPQKVLMKIEAIKPHDAQSLVVFSSSRYMLEFMNMRSVDFCIDNSNFEGLKIPNTAIVEKTALKIPAEFLIESYGEQYVYVNKENKYQLEKVSVLSKNKETATLLQDFNVAKLGAKIYTLDKDKKQALKTFELKELVTVNGIYVINSGSSEFKQIDVLVSNEYYSIIDKNSPFGAKAYDKVVTDSKTISENQLIN